MTPTPNRARGLAAACAACACLLLAATDAAALRIATYNVLNYSGGRTAEFRRVIEEAQPDVLVVEEILSQSAVNTFLADVLDAVQPGEWAAGGFVNGTDTDNGIFYRPDQVSVLGHVVIGTDLRDIDEWTIHPTSHTSPATDIRIYAVHLKASQGSTNEQRRLSEVTDMRQRMETFPVGQNYMVLGDFNIYRSSEPAYQYMIGTGGGPAGVVLDPIGREGNWHVNAAFADVHTQSPRVTSFGGGATGGLDDRFDMLLVAPALVDGEGLDILPATYTAVGQDGLHFDGPLNVPPYVVVDSLTAAALHDASDHLPVYADFQLPAILVAASTLEIGPVITGGTASAELLVANGTPPPADELDYTLAPPPGFTAPAGPFQVEPGAPPAAHPIGVETGTVGWMSGDLVISSDDPDRPSWLVALSGAVLDHGAPSVEAGSVVLAATLDLGSVAAGDTASAGALVYNVGAGPLRALVDVYGFELSGDPRFFIAGGFQPALVGETPAIYVVGFDAAGATGGLHTGTLRLFTRDQQDLSGATQLADLDYALEVVVEGGTAGTGLEPLAPTASGVIALAPNPFRPATEIRFGLQEAGPVRLRIFDVHGRAVRTLLDGGAVPAGSHRLRWDGRDAAAQAVAPGVYFVRLEAAGRTETRKLVRLE